MALSLRDVSIRESLCITALCRGDTESRFSSLTPPHHSQASPGNHIGVATRHVYRYRYRYPRSLGFISPAGLGALPSAFFPHVHRDASGLSCNNPDLNAVATGDLSTPILRVALQPRLCLEIQQLTHLLPLYFRLIRHSESAMRLLNIRECRFELWPDPREVHYAIFSHTWDLKDREMTYQEVCAVLAQFSERRPQARDKSLTTYLRSDKLRNFFQIASRDGFERVWVDTCCIDRADRSELVEAMNSMFDWYGFASACYVYLNNVPPNDNIRARGSKFRKSRWFRRMWTLQELIAPRIVLFFTQTWTLLGSKHTLCSILEELTTIDSKVLTSQTILDDVPMAQRIAWASHRECTRREDEAYSLMGLLGVNMQITYGEGRHAFFRLQVEVLRRYPDQTILAFAYGYKDIPHFLRSSPQRPTGILDTSSCETSFSLLLADSQQEFAIIHSRLANLSPLDFAQRLGTPPSERRYPTFDLVPNAVPNAIPVTIHVNLPVVRVPNVGPCAVLSCEDHSASRALVIASLSAEASSFSPRSYEESRSCQFGCCPGRGWLWSKNWAAWMPATSPVYVAFQPDTAGRPWWARARSPAKEKTIIRGCVDVTRDLVHRWTRRPKPEISPILLRPMASVGDFDQLDANDLYDSDRPPFTQQGRYTSRFLRETGSPEHSQPHGMRLLKVESGEFSLRETSNGLQDVRPARYAILSHVWSKTKLGEQTYQNVQDALEQKHAGTLVHKLEGSSALGARSLSALSHLSEKLRRFCIIALEDKFEFGWADTCCIDKNNPNEVEYAIPEMFNWYAQSGACYVFLHDVESINWRETFSDSEWFERGWTLQELLAPRKVIFVTSDWVRIGTKDDTDIQELITRATRIPPTVLTGRLPLPEVPLAQRFSWIASRKTTRVEDLAYSMMDIVGVKIPVAYGEGRYAFIRLQEEALKRNPSDQTLFAWGHFLQPDTSLSPTNNTLSGPAMRSPTSSQFMLALSPQEFRESDALRGIPQHEFARMLDISESEPEVSQTFEPTPNGIRARLPLLELPLSMRQHPGMVEPHTHLALLSVAQDDDDSAKRQLVLALLLRPHTERGGPPEYLVGTHELQSLYTRATFLSEEQLAQFKNSSSKWVMSTVYIPHYPPRATVDLEYNADIHNILRQPPAGQFEVCLCKWSERLLKIQGFKFVFDRPSLQDRYHILTISRGDGPGLESFRIAVGRCGCYNAANLSLLAVRFEDQASQPAQDADQGPARHEINHEDHVSSWSFSRGVASRLVEATAPRSGNSETKILFNLTLTTAKFRSDAPNNPPTEGTRTYFLGVEIYDPALLTMDQDQD